MELYQLCAYNDCSLEVYGVSENEEELVEIANTLKTNSEGSFFVEKVNTTKDRYYYVEVFVTEKYNNIVTFLNLTHSICKKMPKNTYNVYYFSIYTKQKDGETIEQLKERAIEIAIKEWQDRKRVNNGN